MFMTLQRGVVRLNNVTRLCLRCNRGLSCDFLGCLWAIAFPLRLLSRAIRVGGYGSR
jgi:hypothetical protein